MKDRQLCIADIAPAAYFADRAGESVGCQRAFPPGLERRSIGQVISVVEGAEGRTGCLFRPKISSAGGVRYRDQCSAALQLRTELRR